MQTNKSFKYWQWRVIICSMIGYAMFYFVRKNFSFAIPLLEAEYGITTATTRSWHAFPPATRSTWSFPPRSRTASDIRYVP